MDYSDLFKVFTIDNSIDQYFVHKNFQSTYGDRRFRIGNDGLPVVILKMRVDDIFLHSPTQGRLTLALDFVLDQTMRLGLIYLPIKKTTPSQSVEFCGFIYDMSSVPTLCISEDKSVVQL